MDEYLLKIENISKSFPGVKALDRVRFDLKAGEVHALLGENGAGKSTLMKILGGVYTKDEGLYEAFGREIDDLNPRKAEALGIALIHQELNLCEHLTVAENIFLGREKTKFTVLARREMNEETAKVLKRINIDLDPDTLVGDLPVSKKQMVEIAKALSVNSRVLIMDEPTSALSEREIEDLFHIIRDLRSQGCGIIYISHRLEELKHIADRISVFRDGRYIVTRDYKDTHLDEIITYMVGREIKEKFPRIPAERGKKILEVKNLCSGMVRKVSFDLFEGEILGIAGLMGAGRTELVRALFGADSIDSGEIVLDGETLSLRSPYSAIQNGIVLGPEDRKLEGLCGKLSIRENISLANLDRISNRAGVINRKEEKRLAKRAIDDLQIKTPSMNQLAQNLSGGNQQKIVVGKWLVRNARIVIFDEPTRGIDVAAKVSIYQIMNRLKKEGIGVIFVSSEMPEVLGMADRILVMCNGRVTGEVPASEATGDRVLYYATRYEGEKGDE
ncbi:MAG: sugar ABC transporter ATP-binding protein [Spirochaetales bacterium]|nr:sugar ABC transporter ATP-binding protein [Spirochaetales bacterium]